MSLPANANILPHQINENCLTDNKKLLGGNFFSLRKLALKYIMLPILFPYIYQIWGHLFKRRKTPFQLKALKLTSNYAKLKYSKDESFVSEVE